MPLAPTARVDRLRHQLELAGARVSIWEDAPPRVRRVVQIDHRGRTRLAYVLTSANYAFWGANRSVVDALDHNPVPWVVVLLLADGGYVLHWSEVCRAVDQDRWTNSRGQLKIHVEELEDRTAHTALGPLASELLAFD